MNTVYVHDGQEVVLTNRKAQKKLRSGKIDEVVEIKPVGETGNSFNRWVREIDLFEILGEE